MVPALEEKAEELKAESTKEEAEPKKEEDEKVKDLKKSLADVEAKKEKEVQALEKVRAKMSELIDPPKPKEEDPTSKVGFIDPEKKKPDTSAFKAALAKIEKEEEAKEAILEENAAKKAAYPKNPVVEQSEMAEEAAAEAAMAKLKADKAAEEAAEAAEAAQKKAEKAAAAAKARENLLDKNAELWTANMPEHHLAA